MLLFYIIFGNRKPLYHALGSTSKKTRTTVSLSSMQWVFAESSLRKQAWRNPKEVRVGYLHQNIFTRKVTDIWHLRPTFAIIIHIPRPCIWRPRVPVPHVLTSHSWCPQVPRLASPSPKYPHTRPDVPVPLSPPHFYTQLWINIHNNTLCLHHVVLIQASSVAIIQV